jgi:predicted DNA-binding protein with PD1-like motif
MKFATTKDGFVVRCEIGDEVVSTLVKFAAERGIHSGTVIGIGALKDPELGYYNLEKKEYVKRKYDGDWELASLSGNFARKGSETILHAHAIFSDDQFRTIGGHLFSAQVAVTGEFYIRSGGVEIERGPDAATGLNLMKL